MCMCSSLSHWFRLQLCLKALSPHKLEWAQTINSSSDFLLSFNQDFYFALSSLTVAWPADFTGQGTIQKALISFLKLMSSWASYKLFCQTLTLSPFLPAWTVWAQQNKGLLITFTIITLKWVMFHSSQSFCTVFDVKTVLHPSFILWQTPPNCLGQILSSLWWIDPSLAYSDGKH